MGWKAYPPGVAAVHGEGSGQNGLDKYNFTRHATNHKCHILTRISADKYLSVKNQMLIRHTDKFATTFSLNPKTFGRPVPPSGSDGVE